MITAHERFGVTEHRQRVTRRLAAEGYVSLTVDLFSRFGGLPPQNFDGATERGVLAFQAARDDRAVPDLQAGLEFAKQLPFADVAKAGALGCCLGGGAVLVWATQTDDLEVVVSLYGSPVLPSEYSPTGQEIPRIPLLQDLTAPVQFHFGADDQAIPAGQIDALQQACPWASRPIEFYRYDGAGHAYHDDTHPNYHPEAAGQTWKHALGFLDKHLRSPDPRRHV